MFENRHAEIVYSSVLNISLVILYADPARGGAERYTADLAAALAARGQAVSILATDFGPTISGVQFVQLDSHGATRRGRYARFLNSLDAQLAQAPRSIVHAMTPVINCEIYHPHAGMAAEMMAAKWVNRLNPRRRLFAKVEGTLLNGANPPVVLCLSDYVKQAIVPHYNLPPDRLVTLFNAVDLEKFKPDPAGRNRARAGLKIEPDQTIALMVAHDFERKGLRQTILALKQINDPNLLLLVVGKDDDAPYRQLAHHENVSDRVRFIGPSADPRPFYRAADFFVLPTRHDPCSLVVLESLAMGLPVISTVFNGACQIMRDGVHGFVLTSAKDVAALADAMRRLMDPAARSAMSAACLQLRPRLAFSAHVDRLLEIYDSCNSAAQKSAAR
jgi:UDP-glucose:(heptosyl)LPS alpha-1,3-glucosyltransferase